MNILKNTAFLLYTTIPRRRRTFSQQGLTVPLFLLLGDRLQRQGEFACTKTFLIQQSNKCSEPEGCLSKVSVLSSHLTPHFLHAVSRGACVHRFGPVVRRWVFKNGGSDWGGGVAQLVRASDRHAADSGSIPRCGMGFSSQSQFSVQTLFRCLYNPVCNRMH